MANSSAPATELSGARPEAELNLLLEWPERTSKEWLVIAAATLTVHAIFFLIAIQMDSFVSRLPERPRVIVKHTPLYLPPDVLTQRAANKAELSKQIHLSDLLSQPSQNGSQASRLRAPRSAPPPMAQPAPRQSASAKLKQQIQAPKPTAPEPPKIVAEPPKLTLNQPPPPLEVGPTTPQITAPTPAPQESGPFQNAITNTPSSAKPTIAPPLAPLPQNSRDSNSRRLVINDDNQPSLQPGIPGSTGRSAGQHAQIELKSDPEGVDLHPYLAQILAIVRGNWKRVIPESVTLGKLRGVTGIEFAINRDGSIAKVVIADPSGYAPLDRASVAGLSMSNPLPPLPTQYKGLQLRLAFQFTYNMPNQ